MSADNFIVIRKNGNGYSIVGGSASHEPEEGEDYPQVSTTHQIFNSVAACINAIEAEDSYMQRYYSEYGYSIHEECGPLDEGSQEETEALVIAAKYWLSSGEDIMNFRMNGPCLEALKRYVERYEDAQ